MIRLRLKSILLILSVASCLYAEAQTDRDLASWNGIALDFELSDDWETEFKSQLRLKENFSAVDEYFGQIGVKRKLFKGFKLGAALRYSRRNDNQGAIQGFESRLRYHFQTSYKHSVNRLRIGYRIRYQSRKELGLADGIESFRVNRLRFKTSLEYKIKDWPLDPIISGELFQRFEKNTDSRFDKYRITIGSVYDLNDTSSLSFFWGLESSINETIKDNLYLIGLSYNYAFKN